MSLRQTYAAWRVTDTTGPEKLVLLALADYADNNGERIYPKVETLAEKTSQCEKTVQRCLSSLEKKKYLCVIRGKGRGNLSAYTLMLPMRLLAQYDEACKKKKCKAKLDQSSITTEQEDNELSEEAPF